MTDGNRRHVDGFVDWLRKQSAEKLDERGNRYLKIIADSARQMGTLIDDLLIFSRMSRSDLRRAKVASESLVHEVRNVLQGESAGRTVWKIDSLPQVEADAPMLRQIWTNLIGNAIKYSRTRDPAEIEIGCNTVDEEFVFFVRDNGVGFDMQYVDKLFGVFQRLHRAMNLRARASDWPTCSGSFRAMADACGLKGVSAVARFFISHFQKLQLLRK